MEDWRQEVLLKFSSNPQDYWTVDDAIKGTSILGGTGSGKTSGSGKAIALQFLKKGWGGLVLCAKTDEADLWWDYCKKTNREHDIIHFSKDATHDSGKHEGKTIIFNPLDYEMTREGEGAKEVFNITNIFMNLYKMGNRITNESSEGGSDNRFWDTALKRLLNKTIELIIIANEELTYKNMIAIVTSSPTESKPFSEQNMRNAIRLVYQQNFEDELLSKNYFLKCLALAYVNIEEEEQGSSLFTTYDSIYKYFTESLPGITGQTHTTIVESFMGLAEPFLSGLLEKHFSGKTTLKPEEAFTDNKIILLDFPVKEHLEAGIMAQSIFKLIFQQAVERRKTDEHPTPVFIWADEAQYFLNPYDQIFLTTARSSRAATVFLSQNLSNYMAAMGAKSNTDSQVHSFMGNLATKIFHANSDAVTNDYASNLIGSTIGFNSTRGSSRSLFSMNIQSNKSMQTTYLPQVQPMEFTLFKSGGLQNNFDVEGIVFSTGKRWSTGTNHMKVIFEQNFEDENN